MDGQNDGHNRSPNQRPDEDKGNVGGLRRAEVDERIAVFSIRALGYDPATDDPKPREVLEWARQHHTDSLRRRKLLGVIATGFATAVIGGAAWPLVQRIALWLGP